MPPSNPSGMRRRAVLTAVTAAAGLAALLPATASGQTATPAQPSRAASAPATYLVGGGVVSINPPAAMLANHDFYLGGYGFASGHPGNVTALPSVTGGRYATGILGDGKYGPQGDGVHSRAFAVSDRRHTIVLAQIETQGYFAAYKQGPFGITEIRKDAAAAIARQAAGHPSAAPVPTASQILVDSDHSHGGPDTVGVWGGVPTSYLKLVRDRTVRAIVDAWTAMRPATLRYGVAHAGVVGETQYPPSDPAGTPADRLLTNQFADDPNNQVMDDEVRVLQARDPRTGKVLDTYVNYSSHPTVLGAANTRITGDYVGRLDAQLQQAFGGFAMDQVGTLGREQPARTGCPTMRGSESNPTVSLCELDDYAARVVRKVKEALAVASPLTGRPTVAMNSYYLTDPATSAVLMGAVYAGQLVGAAAARAVNPPWWTGDVIGTTYFVGRIGPVLLTGGPGEMYAQIWQRVRSTVTADKAAGIRDVIDIGTAGDFLGYIIAPLEAYPQPIVSSVASHTTNCDGVPDPIGVCPDPIANDNYFFNVSHTFGERVTCDLLRGAGDVLAGDPTKFWSTYDRCPAFASDLLLAPGTDTTFPSQPDLSGDPGFGHL